MPPVAPAAGRALALGQPQPQTRVVPVRAPGDTSTPRQLALFGFPPLGHPYWTEATLAGTAQRYPGPNMTPWQQALCGEA